MALTKAQQKRKFVAAATRMSDAVDLLTQIHADYRDRGFLTFQERQEWSELLNVLVPLEKAVKALESTSLGN